MLLIYLLLLVMGCGVFTALLIMGKDDVHADDLHAPILSLQFWVAFTAFTGLTGTVLTLLGTVPEKPLAFIAIAMGSLCGSLVSSALRFLRRKQLNSSIRYEDIVGAQGHVVLPLDKGTTGKVRLHVNGRDVELVAVSRTTSLPIGQSIVVDDMSQDGCVVVSEVCDGHIIEHVA